MKSTLKKILSVSLLLVCSLSMQSCSARDGKEFLPQEVKVMIGMKTLPSGGTSTIQSDQRPVKNEAEKVQRVKMILKKYPLNFNAEYSSGLLFYPESSEEERQQLKNDSQYQAQTAAFCTDFYGAMQRADKAIQYIEPIVRTDNPNHPMLKQYHSCADAEDRPNWRGVGEGIYEFIHQIGDRAFRLYRLDLDGNAKNGLEEFLYAELDVKQTLAMSPGYSQIDFERCETRQGLPVYQDQELHTGRHMNNYNAMIRYRGEYYIFDLSDPFGNDSPRYWLNLYRYSSLQRAFVASAACVFRR